MKDSTGASIDFVEKTVCEIMPLQAEYPGVWHHKVHLVMGTVTNREYLDCLTAPESLDVTRSGQLAIIVESQHGSMHLLKHPNSACPWGDVATSDG